MDLLGNLTQEARNSREADRVGLRESARRQAATLLLAGLSAPLTPIE
jgi:hypothetical protein